MSLRVLVAVLSVGMAGRRRGQKAEIDDISLMNNESWCSYLFALNFIL